jgi:hypothetical protein
MRSVFCRVPLLFLLAAVLASGSFFVSACSDSKNSLTGPSGTGAVAGTVILGASSTAGVSREAMPIGLAGVTVKAAGTSRSTMTDGNGQFTLESVPAGNTELDFDRSDLHARGQVTVVAGAMNQITVSIVGSRADIVPGGHSGAEIEGLVSALDTGGGTLTVLDQRLGAVVVKTDGSTQILNGSTAIPLSQIVIGNRVHVKALIQPDGSMLATQILLQSDKVGGNREVQGTVTSVDGTAKSFVVQTASGTATVTTDGSTRFKRRGGSASFSDVQAGVNVDVVGTLQADGTVLARMVTIES